jgi:ABC-2 type transport system ATP-binding protein
VLFLDEPTIGLDVTMQQRIRDFIREYNQATGATVLLTSHYMADVRALASRVVVIDHGKLLYDGALQGLVERHAPHKTITLRLERPIDGVDLGQYGDVVARDGMQIQVRTPKEAAPAVTARMLAELPVDDLSVEDPPLEEVIDQVFRTDRR